MRFGLLGEKLAHSYSPAIHAELGGYEYRLYEKAPGELEHFLARGEFDGLNVTVPYKHTVMGYCGSLSEAARAIGSVNTLTRGAGGALHGDNTDYFGFAYLLGTAGVDVQAGKVLVLGSGGSSLAVQAVLRDMGARFVVVSRGGADNYDNISRHSDAALIINATPVGMYPGNGVSPVDIGIFGECRAVVDLIYNPARTELLMQAEARGALAVNGLAMLVAQAKKAAERFTGEPIADEKIGAIAEKIARLTRNIILVGMPGCGKSSIGAALARRTGREFADTDDYVAEAAGKPVPDILAECGEEAFRRLETGALQELCKRSGLVIATGGGVVTRGENYNIIRQNGVIIYLERDIGLLDTSGRPLSANIAALAAERLPLYSQWGDYSVAVRGVGQTADYIARAILEAR